LSNKDFEKQVDILMGKKDYEGALKLADQELKKSPDYLFAWYTKCISHFWLKEYKKSIDVCTKIIEESKKELAIDWFFLARCHKELKKYTEAIKGYRKSLEIDPKYMKSLRDLEFCYREIKDYENAIRVNKNGTEYYPADLYFWYWLSYSYFQLDDIHNSIMYIFKARKINSEQNEVKELYKSLLEEYKKSIKTKQEFDAIRDIEISEYGNGTLIIINKGLVSLNQIKSLEYTRLILYRLKIGENKIEEISCLDDFPGLRYLELNDNNITRISGLKTTPKLIELKLSDNKISNIEGLENLDNLEILNLSSNQIVKIGGLVNLSKLRRLELDDNQIKLIEGLDNLGAVYSLDLADNQIENTKGLENLPKLEKLDLSNNRINKIEGLEKLTNLNDLNLANNCISIIEGLENLRNLESLNLSNNQIEKIDGLEILGALKRLNLTSNQITSMKNFGKMSNLKRLYLRNNNLTTIDNLELITNLEYLDLRNNPGLPDFIAVSYDGIKEISKLKKYCGMSNEQLQEIEMKEKQLKETIRKQKKEIEKQRIEGRKIEFVNEAHSGSEITSNYSLKHNLRERYKALMKQSELGICFYCQDKIINNTNFATKCASAINQLIYDIDLPLLAKDRNNYTERKIVERVTNRRMDAYDRPGYSTRTRVIKDYSQTSVGFFRQEHFPRLQGVVCGKCSDEFVKKATKYFKRLQRHRYKKKDFTDTIQKSMKKCHENYMKLLESFIEKRGL